MLISKLIISKKINFNFTAAVYSDTKKFLLIHLRMGYTKFNRKYLCFIIDRLLAKYQRSLGFAKSSKSKVRLKTYLHILLQ